MTAVFLKILNMSIAASYLVLAVVLLRLVLKKAPRWCFVLLWGMVAVRLLCPFSIESVWSLVPSAEPIPESVLSVPIVDAPVDVPSAQPPVQDAWQDQIPTDNGHAAPADTGPTVMTWLSGLWMAGVLLMAAYAAVSYGRLRRKVATAVRLEGCVFRSELVASPFILGLFHPRIYLPCSLSQEEEIYILAHEQAHLRRKDHWWKPLGFLLLTVHWFNPLMWAAYALLSRDIEQACDEKVVRDLAPEQRADYSQILLKCSISRRTIAACPLAFGEVGVKERVKNVLHYKKPTFWIVSVAILVCFALAICFLTDPISRANAEQLQPNDDALVEKHPNQNFPGQVDAWHGISGYADSEMGSFHLDAFPGVTFRWDGGKLEAVEEKKITVLADAAGLHHIAAADLNLDGYPEICVTAERSAEAHSCYVIVYDYVAGKSYQFQPDNNDTGYFLFTRSGYLMCAKESLARDESETAGRLMLTEVDGKMELIIQIPPQPTETDDAAILLYDQNSPDSPIRGQVQLKDFPGVTFHWAHSPGINDSSERLVAVKDGIETVLFPAGNTNSVYVADVTGDGKKDLCANVYFFFSGLPSFNAVYVYDYANDRYYILADNSNTNHYRKVSYYVRIEGGKLLCDRIHVATSQVLATGTLAFGDCETGQQLYLKRLEAFEHPVYYTFIEDNSRKAVRLTTCGDGTCTLSFGTNDASGYAQGTYSKQDDRLSVLTDDGRTYLFRFEGENLIFVASGSSNLPEGCVLRDGAVLQAIAIFQ